MDTDGQPAQGEQVEKSVRDQVDELAQRAAEMQHATREERERRAAAGEDTAWLDRLYEGLEPIVQSMEELKVSWKIRDTVDRHGPGPYPAAELATIIGEDVGIIQHVLDQLVAAGLATAPAATPDKP